MVSMITTTNPYPHAGSMSLEQHPGAREAVKQADSRKLHILAIDDQEDILYILQDVLQTSGHLVSTAGSGAAGLQAAAQEQPDLILLDIEMPGIDGFQVLHQLQQSVTTARIPVYFMSGSTNPELWERARQLGARRCCASPLTSLRCIG